MSYKSRMRYLKKKRLELNDPNYQLPISPYRGRRKARFGKEGAPKVRTRPVHQQLAGKVFINQDGKPEIKRDPQDIFVEWSDRHKARIHEYKRRGEEEGLAEAFLAKRILPDRYYWHHIGKFLIKGRFAKGYKLTRKGIVLILVQGNNKGRS